MTKFRSWLIGTVGFFPATVLAQEGSELGEVGDFGELISKIWSWGFVVVISLSVTMIVVGGFMFMASAGNEEKIDQAKQMVNGSLIASGIALFSGVILKLLAQPAGNLETQGSAPELGQLPDTVKNATNILLTMVGGVALVMLLISAYQYVTSAGDVEKLERAKRGLTYAVIGLGVAVGAFIIMNTFIGVFRT